MGLPINATAQVDLHPALHSTLYNPRLYAADGNNPTAAEIQAASDAAAAAGGILYFEPGHTYALGATGVTCLTHIEGTGATLTYSGTGVALTIGHTSGDIENLSCVLPKVIKTAQTWAADVGVKVINIQSSYIQCNRISKFGTGLWFLGSDTGCVYLTVVLGFLENNKVNLLATQSGTGWTNENVILGGHFSHLSSETPETAGCRHVYLQDSGVHPPNSWKFYGPSFEDLAAQYHVEIQGNANLISWARWEVGGGYYPKVYFNNTGGNCYRNRIDSGYGDFQIVLTDTGLYNHILTSNYSRQNITDDYGVMVRNSGGDDAPVYTVVDPGVSATTADPATDYRIQLRGGDARFKASGEDYERLRIETDNRVFLGDGTAAPVVDLYGTTTELRSSYPIRSAVHMVAIDGLYVDGGNGVYNLNGSALAQVLLEDTGTRILRATADANPTLTVTNNHASATGDILSVRNTGGTVAKVSKAGSVVVGVSGPLATNATDGFLYIPTCAGTPTGVPTTQGGSTVALVYDTSAHKLWVYDGAWKGGTVPGVFS